MSLQVRCAVVLTCLLAGCSSLFKPADRKALENMTLNQSATIHGTVAGATSADSPVVVGLLSAEKEDTPAYETVVEKRIVYGAGNFHFIAPPGAYFVAAFEDLNELDRKHFQPWLVFYPSGYRLELTSKGLAQVITEMHSHLGFDNLFIVAHSMGGLVAAGCVNHLLAAGEGEYLTLLSTPITTSRLLDRVRPNPRHPDRVRERRDLPTNLSAIWLGDGQIRLEARLGISPLEDSVEMT